VRRQNAASRRPCTGAYPQARAQAVRADGLTSDALKTQLGTPAFSRKDGGTEMWRYDVKDCHAFFFFTAGKVSHVETIPRPANQAADAGCLSALPKKAS
jgi:hypothetical protein